MMPSRIRAARQAARAKIPHRPQPVIHRTKVPLMDQPHFRMKLMVMAGLLIAGFVPADWQLYAGLSTNLIWLWRT